MHTPKSTWDVERAAAWLRTHAWGAGGEESAPAPAEALAAAAAQAAAPALPETREPDPGQDENEEIDIAGWPALVAPFYD